MRWAIKATSDANGIPTSASGGKGRWLGLTFFGVAALALALFVRIAFGTKPPMDKALHGDSEEAMMALDLTLAKMPQQQRLPFLLQAAQDPSPGLRYAAVNALGDYPSPETAAVIEHAFQDSASTVRQCALERLTDVDQQRGLRLILTSLRDEDIWLREAAINRLASGLPYTGRQTGKAEPSRKLIAPHSVTAATASPPLADRRIAAMLVKVLDDPDAFVPLRAVGLLHRLTGRGSTYKTTASPEQKRQVIAAWKAWWAKVGPGWGTPPDLADVPPVRPIRMDPAPDIQVRDVTGQTLSLFRQHGRVTLLNFWGTWCAPCRIETPALERLHQDYHVRGLDVVGLAVAEQGGPQDLQKWCTRHGLTYRQALATSDAQEAFGDVHEVPVSILIDKQGRIRYRWEGERDFLTFQAAVERLLGEP